MKRSLLSLLCLVFVTIIFAQERVYVPTLKFPANNATSQMPNVIVSWYAISGSLNLQYRFQMDTTKQFNSPLLIDTTQTLITGYQTHELYFGKKYYWRVKAIDNGQTSAWSSVWNFTVFNRVELSAPADTLGDQDPNVSIVWLSTILGSVKKPITGITHYNYQVDIDSNFNSPALIQGTTSITVLKATMVNLRFGTKYYWRVRAGHNKANSSYCPFRYFKVIDKFTLQSPTNNLTKVFLNAQLKWKVVNGLLAYSYEIAKDHAFTQLVAESEVDTNFVLASDLQFGVTYYWRVKGRHLTDTSEWSNSYSFTTINTVDLKNPTNNQTNTAIKPTFQWTKQTGIVNYEIWVSADLLFQNPLIKYKPTSTETQYLVTKAFLYQTTYYWKMRVYSDGGITADTSDWSPVWSFTTLNTSGVEEIGLNSLSIYPNPTSGKIYLKMDSKENTTIQFELFDLLGKKVIEKPVDISVGTNLKEIVLENVNKGIYLMHLTANGSSINQKIVVDK